MNIIPMVRKHIKQSAAADVRIKINGSHWWDDLSNKAIEHDVNIIIIYKINIW